MPRPFEVTMESPATVDQVHDAFGDRDYWVDRLTHFGGAKSLEELTVGEDGTITVVVAEDLRHGALPGILAKLYRGDLNILSTETWRPTADGRVHGDIDVKVIGAPGSGSGRALLGPAAQGSQLDLAGLVEFRVPLVGGRIESFVAGQFIDGFADINRFTTEWIAGRA